LPTSPIPNNARIKAAFCRKYGLPEVIKIAGSFGIAINDELLATQNKR
jgi:hypothetical protein